MKAGFLVLIAVLLALLAAALAPVFKTDPGLVQLQFHGWTVETSLLVLVLAILLLWLLGWVLVRLWKLPRETARKVREQRALAQLEKGLLALTEGDWQTAERALERSASAHGRTTARYLAAAEAADGQDAGDRAEYYLEQADLVLYDYLANPTLVEYAPEGAELVRLGAPIRYVDVGGGLGVDYEGTRTRGPCSVNYGLEDYAVKQYASLVARDQDAGQCVECGPCLDRCPQSIPIPDQLKESAAMLG